MSRQNDLADPVRPEAGTAAPAAVSLIPRPRPVLRSAPVETPWTAAAEPWDAAGEHDWDRDWAAALAVEDADPTGPAADDDVPAAAGSADRRSVRAWTRDRIQRLPAAPRRRPALLLAALVAGALIAAASGGLTGPAVDPSTATGLDYGLGLEDTGFAGGVDATGARGEISQVEALARLGEIAASRAARLPKFAVPTVGRMSTCFCTRWGTMHWGIDLAAPLGTPIVAAADGVVLRAGPASGYGNAIYIQDADGNVEIYGHMRHLYVRAGDVVATGDVIAKVGSEGQSTGPHLHFEIHKGGMNGRPTDPQRWLADRGLSVG